MLSQHHKSHMWASCKFHTNILKILWRHTVPSQYHASLLEAPHDILGNHCSLHSIIGLELLNAWKINENVCKLYENCAGIVQNCARILLNRTKMAWKSCDVTYCLSEYSLIIETSHDVMWSSCKRVAQYWVQIGKNVSIASGHRKIYHVKKYFEITWWPKYSWK